jgi:hypothetical protein
VPCLRQAAMLTNHGVGTGQALRPAPLGLCPCFLCAGFVQARVQQPPGQTSLIGLPAKAPALALLFQASLLHEGGATTVSQGDKAGLAACARSKGSLRTQQRLSFVVVLWHHTPITPRPLNGRVDSQRGALHP